MILWPGGTRPYPAPPQLLFLCWGPGCSLLLSLTCSWHYHYPVYPQGQGWGWDFFKLLQESLFGEYSHVACVPTPCAQRPLRTHGCSASLPQQAQVRGTGVGQESCSLSLPVSQLLKTCPSHCFLPTLWTRTFIHGTLPCTGLLHRSCGSLPCQDSKDFQGAGLREGGRLGECWGVGTHDSRIVPWSCSSVAHHHPPLHALVPAGCARPGRSSWRAPCCPPALIPALPHLTGP